MGHDPLKRESRDARQSWLSSHVGSRNRPDTVIHADERAAEDRVSKHMVSEEPKLLQLHTILIQIHCGSDKAGLGLWIILSLDDRQPVDLPSARWTGLRVTPERHERARFTQHLICGALG